MIHRIFNNNTNLADAIIDEADRHIEIQRQLDYNDLTGGIVNLAQFFLSVYLVPRKQRKLFGKRICIFIALSYKKK